MNTILHSYSVQPFGLLTVYSCIIPPNRFASLGVTHIQSFGLYTQNRVFASQNFDALPC